MRGAIISALMLSFLVQNKPAIAAAALPANKNGYEAAGKDNNGSPKREARRRSSCWWGKDRCLPFFLFCFVLFIKLYQFARTNECDQRERFSFFFFFFTSLVIRSSQQDHLGLFLSAPQNQLQQPRISPAIDPIC